MDNDVSSNPEAQDLKIKLKKHELEKDLHQKKAETFYRRKTESRKKALKEQMFDDHQKNFNVLNNSSNYFFC